MRVEVAVRSHLLADAGVAALVGTRGYTQRFPQNPVLPAFRVQLIDEQEPSHLRGGCATRFDRVQVDAVGAEASGVDVYAQVADVAEAIAAALMSQPPFEVSDGGSPATVVELKVIERQSRPPRYDPEELRQVVAGQDFLIWSRVVA